MKTLSNLPYGPRRGREATRPPPAVVPDVAPAGVCPAHRAAPAGHRSPSLEIRRLPHFSASYRYYLDNPELGHVGAVSFGETIPLFRGNGFADSQWEVGIQGGVFALFQMDAPSKDLVNADYFGSVFGTWRRGPFSALGRIFHQSSHLGDELLVRTRLERINLTYRAWTSSSLRFAVGLGVRAAAVLVRQEPESLSRGAVQGRRGVPQHVDVAPATSAGAAVDLQSREEKKWNSGRCRGVGPSRFETVGRARAESPRPLGVIPRETLQRAVLPRGA